MRQIPIKLKDSVIKQISLKDVDVVLNARLTEHSFMRLDGMVAAIATPTSKDALVSLIRVLCDSNTPFLIAGRMSNVCPVTDFYDGVLVKTTKINSYTRAENQCVCDCGASICAVASFMSRFDLGGAEALYHIPASVGGMLHSNAGAYGSEISDIVEWATVYDSDGDNLITLRRDELEFGYRSSVLEKKNYYVVSCALRFEPSSQRQIREKIAQLGARRRLTQPLDLPSLGSVFKRVGGVGAGYYIERAGLKGFRVGDAAISEKHAGFIVNLGTCTPTDVVRLKEIAKEQVLREFGITLQEEVRFFEGG